MKMFPNAIYEDELKNNDGIKNKGEPKKKLIPKFKKTPC